MISRGPVHRQQASNRTDIGGSSHSSGSVSLAKVQTVTEKWEKDRPEQSASNERGNEKARATDKKGRSTHASRRLSRASRLLAAINRNMLSMALRPVRPGTFNLGATCYKADSSRRWHADYAHLLSRTCGSLLVDASRVRGSHLNKYE